MATLAQCGRDSPPHSGRRSWGSDHCKELEPNQNFPTFLEIESPATSPVPTTLEYGNTIVMPVHLPFTPSKS